MINNYSKLNELLDELWNEYRDDEDLGMKNVSETTYKNSKIFLGLLEDKCIRNPKIAPDGMDGIVFGWESETNCVITNLTEDRFSFVKFAGKPHAEYKDDILFNGKEIPKELLEAIITL
jgi:hypothetical protein